MLRPVSDISMSSMNHQLTKPPSGADDANRRGLTAVMSGILFFLSSPAGWGVEAVAPLVTPAIIPAQEKPKEKPKDGEAPGPALGFTTPPADTNKSNALPLPDDRFGALPGDPNAILPAPDEFPAPLTMEELAELTNPSVAEDTLPPIGPASDRENFGETLGSLSQTPRPPGMGGRWPSGFADAPANMLMGGGLLNDLRDGLGFSASLSGTYDTNPSQGTGTAQNSGQGDFFTTLGGTAAYRSRASTWTYGATYSGSYNQYLNESDFSGYNQNAGASLNYQGGSLSASLNCGIDFGSGANRYYASVVDEISYNYNLTARYRFSRKTSITGDLSQRFTRVSGDGGSDTDSLDLGASALWKYSRLTEFGPGIRYTSDSGGDSRVGRSSIGPTLTVNYQLAEKLSLNSRFGMDFPEYDDGTSSDSSWSTFIDLNYKASKIWGMNLSLMRDAQASYTSANEFEELTALRLGYNRRIRRVMWTLGAGWETRTSQNSDTSVADRPDRNYLTLDTALSMRVFADTCSASIFMRYSDQSGDSNETWDSFQSGFSISRSF